MASFDGRNPSSSELRWFGAIVAVVFGVIGFALGWQFEAVGLRRSIWSAGAATALLYYSVPSLRVPFYLIWMTVFAPIGSALSILLLGLVYFGVLTPISMLMTLLRRDRLGRRFDPERATYWIRHDPSGDVDRYFRQT